MRFRFTYKNCLFLAFLVVFANSHFLKAEIAWPDEKVKWRSQWIGTEKPSLKTPPNTWICFRKKINLEKKPQIAIARIAVDSKYWLWINGKSVVRMGQLKRGPAPDTTWYDIVDIASYLTEGENTIAIQLWYMGKNGFSHVSSNKAGLVFDADIDGQPCTSDSSWKAIEDLAYGNTHEPHPNYRLPESNILFDAQKSIGTFYEIDYDDSEWSNAIPYGQPPVDPWGKLYARPIPLWKDYGIRNYTNSQDIPKEGNGEYIVCNLPYNLHANPCLEIDAPSGLKIEIQPDMYIIGGQPQLRFEYITKQGQQSYEFPTWINCHEVKYLIPKGVKINSLTYRETGYDAEFQGSFTCDDDFFNTLWTKSLRTLYVNMRDTFMDCPDRERAQWWGDEVHELAQAFYTFGPKGYLLAKKGIYDLASWQNDQGIITAPCPSGIPAAELPMQMLASVSKYGFWTYYFYTADKKTLIDVYPSVKKYINVWQIGEDGLVVQRDGWDLWGDWGSNKDMSVMLNAWYYMALDGQLKMAELLNIQNDIPSLKQKMKTIEENFNKTFWNNSEYKSKEHQGPADDRANALAVVSGLADSTKYESIRKVFQTTYESSPYLERFVIESIFKMGYPNDALNRIKKRWKETVQSPRSTIWEHFDFGDGSYNHGWSGGAMLALAQFAVGLTPLDVGYNTIQILPQPGYLKKLDLSTMTVKGRIKISINNENSFKLTAVIPPETSAVIGVPFEYVNETGSIKIDDTKIWDKGNFISTSDIIKSVGLENGFIKFIVMPGTWNFEAVTQ